MATRTTTLRRVTKKAAAAPAAPDRDQLIVDHLPLVKYLAQRIATRLPASVEVNDLISAGILGLIDAVEKFEPERGIKFTTYARRRICGAILDDLRSLDWAPRSLRKKARDLESTYAKLERELGRSVSDEEVAVEMGMALEEYHQLLGDLNGITIGGFETIADNQDDGGSGLTDMLNYLPDSPERSPQFIFERSEIREYLTGAIERLPEKERLVISLYYHDELTMKEIGHVLGVNESRVSQLHTRAVLRLRGKLKAVIDNPKN
jgi:RNA polymerase sigma factor for flagellar operon FliA